MKSLSEELKDLLSERTAEYYSSIEEQDSNYYAKKEFVKNFIASLMAKDEKTAKKLQAAIEIIEFKIVEELYVQGFKDGKEFKNMSDTFDLS